METDGEAWLEIQDRIRDVLNHQWDPIGVAHIVEDEYDGYIGEIYALLKIGSSAVELVEHLRSIEANQMELRVSPMEKLRAVADSCGALDRCQGRARFVRTNATWASGVSDPLQRDHGAKKGVWKRGSLALPIAIAPSDCPDALRSGTISAAQRREKPSGVEHETGPEDERISDRRWHRDQPRNAADPGRRDADRHFLSGDDR